MVWFFTQAIMMIGVPYILAVLPLHVWRWGCRHGLPLAAQRSPPASAGPMPSPHSLVLSALPPPPSSGA